MPQTEIDGIADMTEAELDELRLALEDLHRQKMRADPVFFAQNMEIPGTPPALTKQERALIGQRRRRQDVTRPSRVDDEDVDPEAFEALVDGERSYDDYEFYARKMDVATHHELILNAVVGLMTDAPVPEHLRNGMPEDVRPDGVMLFFPPGAAKPVWEEELVLMADGSRRPLKEVRVGDWVVCESGKGRRVAEVHQQGELECLQIQTGAGRTIRCAPDHPILTASGYVDAGNLIEGDILALMANARKPTDCATDQDVAKAALAGYLVGGGCVRTSKNQWGATNQQAVVTCGDPAVAADVVKMAELAGFAAKISEYGYKTGTVAVQLSGGVREWIRETGMSGQCSRTKRVPEFVWRLGESVMKAFLGAYMACDGSVYEKQGRNHPVAAVDSVTVNRDLAADLQELWLRLGIASTVYSRRVGYVRKDGTETVAHRVKLEALHDVWRAERELAGFWVGEKYDRFQQFSGRPTRIDQTLLPDKVVAITKVGRLPCRCLTIDVEDGEEGSFVVNGIVVHNSTYGSVIAPAYIMGRFPGTDVISCSYGAELAKRFGRRVRHIARDDTYRDLFDTELVADNAAVDQWSLTNGSTYRAVGVLGGVTGFRGDCVFLDDPIAGREEAESDVIRNKINDAIRDDLLTRLKPNGKLVVIQTRWHQDDPAGMLLGEEWDGESGLWEGSDKRIYLVLCCPLVCERDDDPLGRNPGDRLWPEWFDDRFVEFARAQGARSWNSLYQQRPSASDGQILLRSYWRVWPHGDSEPTQAQVDNPTATDTPDARRIFLSYDTAFEDGEEADYSAMTAWCSFPRTSSMEHRRGEVEEQANLCLIGAWRGQVQAADLFDIVMEHVQHFKPDHILIEKRASGIQLIQELQRRRPHFNELGRTVYVDVIPWLPRLPQGAKGKVPRAWSASVTLAAGTVWRMPGRLMEAVVQECAQFPNGRHDDWVDSVTAAILWARDYSDILEIPDDLLSYEEQREIEIEQAASKRSSATKGGYGRDGIERREFKRSMYGRL